MSRYLHLFRIGLDRTTIYLPVILTALLALGTYWLVRNAPKLLTPAALVKPLHEPDAFMRGFVVKNFLPSGVLRSELFGQEGRHFPDTDTFEVDQVRVRSISDAGAVIRASADRGISNADGTEIQLIGNALVVREATVDAKGKPQPQLQFQGEFLHAFTDTERVVSNRPVTLVRGTDHFSADAMDYDNLSGVLNLHGRVHGTIVPESPAPRAP